MPLDKFGYYSLVEPLQKDTTKWVKKQKQVLLEKLMAKYKDNLNYYSHLKSSEQTSLAVDIITDLEHRSLLLVMKENGDLNFYAKNKTVFNTYIEMFERFGREKNKTF
jgi:predicted YcjX-like family ATPase